MFKKLIYRIGEKGIALPLVLLIILVLIPLGLGLSYLIKPEARMVVKGKGMAQAIQIADAGVRRAEAEIINNPSYTGPGGIQNLSTGQYDITISTPGCVFEGNLLPADRYGIETIGYVPNMAQPREKKKVVALVNRESYSPFDYAVTAGDGGIDLFDTCQVNGDVITSGTVNDETHVTGVVKKGVSLVSKFPSPVVPGGAINLGAINITGNTNYVINPGTYTCTSIDILGNAKVTIDTALGGEVYLYCSGNIDVGGTGFVNTGCDATTFFLYGTGASGNIKLHGTSDVYIALYAPTYDCDVVGTSWIKGAINVRKYTQEGTSDIQYEAGLGGMPGKVVQVKIFSWREEKI